MPNTPAVIDLFSGVGGFSLGAAHAGLNIAGAVEIEKRILDSHAKNFPRTKHICEDVAKLDGSSLSSLTGINKLDIAGLIGGPPCQGFSNIGNKQVDDKRNTLFIQFFKLVSDLNPVFFIAENVPGILTSKYDGIRQRALKLVEKNYEVEFFKLTASDFGAATIRTRVFFIGLRNDISQISSLETEIAKQRAPKPTVVKSALAGLPVDISDEWQTFEASWQKVIRHNANKYVQSLNRIIEGIGDVAAVNRTLLHKEVSGCFGTKHSAEVAKRYKKLFTGQQDRISKSVKLDNDGFCPTLRAGTDNTRGSFQAVRPIHPTQSRVITPREAARLQGFPDWFQFHSTKWHSFRQIGNSVCPIVAEKVMNAVRNTINI